MKRGAIISIIVGIIVLAGAAYALWTYYRNRCCAEYDDIEEDYMPDFDDYAEPVKDEPAAAEDEPLPPG